MKIDGGLGVGGGAIPAEEMQEVIKQAADNTKAGNLKGSNLQFSERVAMDKSNAVGQPYPKLQNPAFEPSMQNYEKAWSDLNNANVQLVAEDQSRGLAKLLDKFSDTDIDGKGGVVADDIRLKNVTPEQLKELKGAMEGLQDRLSMLHSADSEKFDKVMEDIDKFKQNLSSGEANTAEVIKQMKEIINTLDDKSFVYDSSKDDRLSSRLNELDSRLPDVEDIVMNSSETGVSGTMGNNQSFSADFEKGSLRMDFDGQTQKYSFDPSGGLSATVNGNKVEYDPHETRIMTDFFQVMALFHEMGVTMRQSNREGRNAAQAIVVDKIKAQAAKQRTAATQQLVAGLVSAGVKIGAGAIQIGGAAKALKAVKLGNNAKADALSNLHRGVSGMLEGSGEIVASIARHQASLTEAEVTDIRAEEENARFLKQTAQDHMEVAKELSTKARETYSQVFNSILQAQQKITGNI